MLNHLSISGILSIVQYRVFDKVSGKNPFFPNKASIVGSKPFPCAPSCRKQTFKALRNVVEKSVNPNSSGKSAVNTTHWN